MRRGFRGREMRMSFSQKLSRLAVRMKDPEWRRYAGVLFGGKVLGIAVVLLTITVISGLCFAHEHSLTQPAALGSQANRSGKLIGSLAGVSAELVDLARGGLDQKE